LYEVYFYVQVCQLHFKPIGPANRADKSCSKQLYTACYSEKFIVLKNNWPTD